MAGGPSTERNWMVRRIEWGHRVTYDHVHPPARAMRRGVRCYTISQHYNNLSGTFEDVGCKGNAPGKDERYRLTFDWRVGTLSQSEIRVHLWTHNSKKPTNLGRREFNWTLYQSSHGFATRVHGFASKTKALALEIPPATQANYYRFEQPVGITVNQVRPASVAVAQGYRMYLRGLGGNLSYGNDSPTHTKIRCAKKPN